jgi:hypothetical protein
MAKTPATQTTTVLVRGVPVEVWRGAKAKAAQRGETLRDAIIRVLREWVKAAA